VCSLPGVAGQLAGHDVGTALNGVLGTAEACQG
jgi:hypothetical protein